MCSGEVWQLRHCRGAAAAHGSFRFGKQLRWHSSYPQEWACESGAESSERTAGDASR
jgi:hypothetical protein